MIKKIEGKGKTVSYDGDLAYPVPEDYRMESQEVTYGEVRPVEYWSKTTDSQRRAVGILPPGYSQDRNYPVVYLCHGLGQDETQWLEEGKAGTVLGKMIADGDAVEMILVLANCRAWKQEGVDPEETFSLAHYAAFNNFLKDFTDDLQPFIEDNFSVATGRENTAVAGFSMGGRVALHLGITLQDTFGGIGAFCPAPGIFPYTNMNVTEDGLFTERIFDLKERYRDRTMIMIVAGKSDPIVKDYPESYHDALEKNGVEHIWYKRSGGHDMDVSGQGLWHFLKEISRFTFCSK